MKKIAATLIAFAALTHTAAAETSEPEYSGSFAIFATQMAEASVNFGLAAGWEYSCGHVTAEIMDGAISMWASRIATTYYMPEDAQEITEILMRATNAGAQLALEYDCSPETGAALVAQSRGAVERLLLIGE